MIVSGLRRALDEAGHRSVQRPSEAALGMWQPPPGERAPIRKQLWEPWWFRQMEKAEALFRLALHDRRPTFLTPPPQARAEAAHAPVPQTIRFPLGVARGQVAKTYIVAEAEDGLVLVDQHAAHERLVLERMRRAMQGGGVASQALLLAEVVELDEPACDRLEARIEELAQFGLELERFGPRAMLVRATPAALGRATSTASSPISPTSSPASTRHCR
jgi:DNA mismatch repair protein MutL